MPVMRARRLELIILAFFLLALAGGCATVPSSQPAAVSEGPAYLKDLCEKNNLVCKWDSLSQVVSLKGNDLSAKMLLDSNVTIVDGRKVFLNDAARIKESRILVPPDFKAKVIDALIKLEVKSPEKRVYTQTAFIPPAMSRSDFIIRKVDSIIIDAGHGGKDPGAIGRTGLHEKQVVLDIAFKLKNILERKGFKVRLTRSSDEFISLQRRTEIASTNDADLFVSIHANSSPSRDAAGVEIYTLVDISSTDKRDEQRKLNHELRYKNLDMSQNDANLEGIVSDMYYSNKQSESEKLARNLLSSMSLIARSRYRGIKEERYFVLRNTLIPAVLVEVGFLSNPKEERLLGNKSYRQKVADSLAKGIIDYVHQ